MPLLPSPIARSPTTGPRAARAAAAQTAVSAAAGGWVRGGGLLNPGSEAIVAGFSTLDLSHCELMGNRATGGAGGTGAPGGRGGDGIGGGILNLGPADATVSHSTLALNQATG